MTDTIPAITTKTGENPKSSLAPENISSLQPQQETLCLSGVSSKTIVDNKVSTVPCSAMKAKPSHLTLSERLTPLLISAGLVKGTTLTFGRRLSRRGIPAGVSFAPDGSVVDLQKEDLLF